MELILGAFESLNQICVDFQATATRCGTVVNIFLFVESIDVLGNKALHDGTFRLQDLQQKKQR